MGTAYTFPICNPLPGHLVVRVVVARADGSSLDDADIDAAGALYARPTAGAYELVALSERKAEPTFTQTPGGQLTYSLPNPIGPKVLEYPVPGGLGALLSDLGYIARVVVERADGGAVVEGDRMVVGDAMTAAGIHGSHSPRVREATLSGHIARAFGTLDAGRGQDKPKASRSKAKRKAPSKG